MPGIFSGEHLKLLVNLIHFPSLNVKEEIAHLLLIISGEFGEGENDDHLMEIQRQPHGKAPEEGFKINFNDEPNKSQKQILRLVSVFEKHIQTRAQYIKELKGAN
jgi:hypothetical protein